MTGVQFVASRIILLGSMSFFILGISQWVNLKARLFFCVERAPAGAPGAPGARPRIRHIYLGPLGPAMFFVISATCNSGAPGALQGKALTLVPLGPLGPDPVSGFHKKKVEVENTTKSIAF